MDRVRGLLIIGVLILIGFLVNHFVFQTGFSEKPKHSTTTISMETPQLVVTRVKLGNVSVVNYFAGIVTLNPLTPFVKPLVLNEPRRVVIVVRGANASSIRIFIAIESGGSVSIESPQLYRVSGSDLVFSSMLPPGLVSVIVLNASSHPLTLGLEIRVEEA